MITKQGAGNARRVAAVLLTLLLLALIAFIWENSARSMDESGERSTYVAEMLPETEAEAGGVMAFLVSHIRKVAHFLEYALLGALGIGLLIALGRVNVHTALHILLLVLLVAVIDEAIQIYSPGRTSNVMDVLLDFAGGIGGVLLTLLGRMGVLRLRRR